PGSGPATEVGKGPRPVYARSSHERCEHSDRTDLETVDLNRVTVEEHQVSELSRGDTASPPLIVARPGGVEGVGTQRLFGGDAFVGAEQDTPATEPLDHGLHTQQWGSRRDRPIRASRNTQAVLQEGTVAVEPRRPVGA